MTCAQGLLRLLWGGGPKLECYGTGYRMMLVIIFEQNFLFYHIQGNKLIYTNNPTYLTSIHFFLFIRKEKQGDQIE